MAGTVMFGVVIAVLVVGSLLLHRQSRQARAMAPDWADDVENASADQNGDDEPTGQRPPE